jgi:hypothetical protein
MIEAYLITAFISLLLATAELFNKFKDEPLKVITRYKAWGYILLNVAIALLTLYILTQTDLFGSPQQLEGIKAGFTAGLGSSVLMRSKFLKIDLDGKEAAIGPEVIINTFLEMLERSIDRDRALIRKQVVEELMTGIDFDKAKNYAVTTVIAASQTMSPEVTEELMAEADKIQASPISAADKSYALGYLVLDMMGEKFLKALFTPKTRSRFLREEAGEQGAGSREQGAGSREQGAGSR